MSDAMRTFFIFAGLTGVWIWIFLQGIENKKKEEALKKKEDKPWILLPNFGMMIVYAIGIIYLICLVYGFAMFANIIGPFGLIFLILWLVSKNKNKE